LFIRIRTKESHMLTRSRRATSAAIVTTIAAAAMAMPTAASAAEVFFASTPGNDLVSFTAQAPNRILHTEPINGLAAAETIVGMDQRPATGQLYALTSSGRILVVNTVSGDTKAIGSPITLTGNRFGFDFNPVVDRIRITSDLDQNLRVNPDTGALVQADGTLAYGAGDPGTGANPAVSGSGYTLGVFGGAAPASTTLFDIDTARNTLVRQDPPNDGGLVTIGALGIDVTDNVQMDVAGNQAAYAALATEGQTGVSLYSINTLSGNASPTAGSTRIGVDAITSLAAMGETPDDTRAPAVAIGNYTTYRSIWLDRGLNFTLSCPEDCNSVVTLRLGSTVLGTTTVDLDNAGTKVARIALTSTGRMTAGAANGVTTATLTFVTRDAANNKRTQVTTFKSLD